MKHRVLLPLLIFIGLLSAAAVSADTSTRGCETNTMKAGVFCNWAEGKSWCSNNTNTCAVESTTACPANPTGGTYAFSCNVNTCVLTCNSGYTLCTGVCHPNVAVPSNCTSFDQCTDVCSACAAGYELVSGSCVTATVKLGIDSLGALNHLFQSSNPVLSISGTNVGIGTTSPNARLEIIPTTGYAILAGNYKIGNVASPTVDADAATKGYVDSAIASATSSGGLPTGTTSQTLRHNGTTWIASSNIFNNDTNVGFGTTTPGSKLVVSGDSYISGNVGLGDVASSTIRLLVRSTASSAGVPAALFKNSLGTDIISLSSSGHGSFLNPITVGTTVYQSNYSIAATANLLATTGAVGGINAGGNFIPSSGNATFAAMNFTAAINQTGGANGITRGIYISPNLMSAANFRGFEANVAAGTNRWAYYGAGTAFSYFGGNVGIGTSSPAALLSVAPASGYAILAGNYKIGNVALPTADADAATKGYVDSTVASATSSLSGLPAGTTGQTLRHDGSDWIANSLLYNNGVNIGIGTTTPLARLDVAGQQRITGVSTGTNTYLQFANAGSNLFFAGSDAAATGGSASDFNLFTYGANDLFLSTNSQKRITIDSTGNVGIGTTTPEALLEVQGSVPMIKVRDAANSASIKMGVINSSGSYYPGLWMSQTTPNTTNYTFLYVNGTIFNTPSGQPMYFRVGNANAIVISSASNVGIGTTTPTARLSIAPTTGYAIMAGNYKIGNVALPTADADAATKGYVDSTIASATSSIGGLPAGTSGQSLRHNGTTWVASSNIFNNDTNVGIGTTTPTEKLEVDGKLKIGTNTVSGENVTFDGSTSAGMRVANSSGYINITPLNTSWAHIYTDRANFIFDKPIYSIVGKFSAYNTVNLELQTAGITRIMASASTGYVGIGTSSPTALLSVAPSSGYAILAGNYRIGNVALPTADADAATKGYVDASIASATSSGGLPAGVASQTLRHNGTTWVANSLLYNNGTNIGIGTTAPSFPLSLGTGTGSKIALYDAGSGGGYGFGIQSNLLQIFANGSTDRIGLGYGNSAAFTETLSVRGANVGIGTTSPLAKLSIAPSSGYAILAGNYRIGNVALPTASSDAATKGYVDAALGTSTAVGFLPLAGGTMTGAINMGNNNISNINTLTVNKLNATTIDPLYNIKGINYSTFAPSIAGGVKEEYTGKIKIVKLNVAQEYEAVIDFADIEEGSDLWLWRQVIDFNKDSVDVAVTPYGRFARVYYMIYGNKLIFRADSAIEISYRLTAKRFDWRDWPTRSNDQTTPGLKIEY